MACSCRTCRSPSEWMIDLAASLVERNFRERTLLASWTRLPLTPKAEPNASSAPRKKATDIGRRARGHSAPESSARSCAPSLRRSVLRTSIAQPGARLVSQAPKPVSGMWSVMAVV